MSAGIKALYEVTQKKNLFRIVSPRQAITTAKIANLVRLFGRGQKKSFTTGHAEEQDVRLFMTEHRFFMAKMPGQTKRLKLNGENGCKNHEEFQQTSLTSCDYFGP